MAVGAAEVAEVAEIAEIAAVAELSETVDLVEAVKPVEMVWIECLAPAAGELLEEQPVELPRVLGVAHSNERPCISYASTSAKDL